MVAGQQHTGIHMHRLQHTYSGMHTSYIYFKSVVSWERDGILDLLPSLPAPLASPYHVAMPPDQLESSRRNSADAQGWKSEATTTTRALKDKS